MIYYSIIYYTKVGPARQYARAKGPGVAAHWKTARFLFWDLWSILCYIILYFIILYYTILHQCRPRPPASSLELGVLGAAAPSFPRFQFWELHILFFYVMLSCIILYYTIPTSAPPTRPSEREGQRGRSASENSKISILGVVKSIVLYQGRPRSPVRPSEANCKVSILGVVNYIVLCHIILYDSIL